MKILIIKPSSLGDIIHALPFLSGLKELYPKSEVFWLVNEEYKELLAGHPLIKKLMVMDRKSWKKRPLFSLKNFFSLIKFLKKEKFEIVFDLQGLFRTGLIAFLSGSPLKICFNYTREGSSIFYNKRLGTEKLDVHAVDRMISILEDLGWKSREVTRKDFFIKIPQDIEIKINNILREKNLESSKLVVINPFSRWETKKWGIDKYTELADVLIDRFKVKVILVGIQEDKQEGKKIESNIKKNLINLVGETTLLELAVLLKKSNLLISCDSGPVHLANALGLKTITLFGPTSSRRTGAYLVGNIIVTKYKECAPCYKKKCSDLGCMKDIEVADIVREVEKLSF